MLTATIIDWQALLETSIAALIAGVGVALTFSLAILGVTRSSEASRDSRGFEATGYFVLAFLGFAATAAAIAFGIIVMTSG